ncbi:hypothetical protein PINS_up024099 [Pythium insidiosum]|nr:hypothetical protein PINS_up024099 [Pythium insidiosum]
MAKHGVNIPPLPDLANADALDVVPAGAPRVVAGGALDVADIARAKDDYRARKKLKHANLAAPSVTVAEVESAAIRHHAIVSEHAAHLYAGAGAPAWFAAALRPLQDAVQGLQDAFQQQQNTARQTQNALEGLRDDFQQHQNALHGLRDDFQQHQNALQGLRDDFQQHQNALQEIHDIVQHNHNAVQRGQQVLRHA